MMSGKAANWWSFVRNTSQPLSIAAARWIASASPYRFGGAGGTAGYVERRGWHLRECASRQSRIPCAGSARGRTGKSPKAAALPRPKHRDQTLRPRQVADCKSVAGLFERRQVNQRPLLVGGTAFDRVHHDDRVQIVQHSGFLR